ncbi:PREDICTED: angiopoietin-1 receptor-like, partial [Branchiostoma belcheri]|uniref:Angiopoietin-1 receptor-like n=1 Tax=Branchiostoma belcheri TaxID=7741 RepID=A0A6P4ZZW3_BRABE
MLQADMAALRGAVVVIVIATSAGNWLPPAFSHDFITFNWDATGFVLNETRNESFVKYVVQLYKTKNDSCDNVIQPPMVQEIPVYYLQHHTFTRLNLSHLYCSNCTIVSTLRNVSCGKYNAIPIVKTTERPLSFNSKTVTNTSITVTWPSFSEQNRNQKKRVFYYYQLDIAPLEPNTNGPLVIFNETEVEGTLTGLIPGKEYQIQLKATGDANPKVEPHHFTYTFITTDIIATDPSPVEEVSVIHTSSTSVRLKLIPPKEGFVDLFQIQATSTHHSSPLVDVPLPEGNPASVKANLFNLQPETTYTISAMTVAKGNRGKAKEVICTTEPVPIDTKLVGWTTGVIMVVVIAAAFCTVRIVKRLKYRLNPAQLFKEVLEDIIGSEKMEPWLKKRKNLFLEELIGEGEFGHVRKGVLREEGQQAVIVAAKTLRVDRANEITYRDFAKEASLLIEVNDDGGHVNIVSLIGLVVDGKMKK